MFRSQEIATLQARIAEVETSAAQAKATFEAAIAAQNAELDAAVETIATHAATVVDRDAKIAALEAEIVTVKEGVETEITNRLASAGVAPIARDPEASNGKDLPRADFAKLSPQDQSKFCLEGGRIV